MNRTDVSREPFRTPIAHKRGARLLPALLAVAFIGLALYASQASIQPVREDQQSRSPKDAPGRTTRAVAAANKFLKALNEEMRARALLAFDNKKRSRWSNLPVTMVQRNGVELAELNQEQRAAAMELLAAILSKQGYEKVVDIMNGDQVLAQRGGGKGPRSMFGNERYYLAIFGKPSASRPWLVQFGGHHLGLNVTMAGKDFVLTPTHTGAQPASFTWEDKRVRPLGQENDRAFKLINALDEMQQSKAILGPRPRNLALGPGRDGQKIEPEGVKASSFTASQQAMLLDLIGAWVHILDDDTAANRMAEIKKNIGEAYFAWSGPTTNGSAVYFRVQGPTVLIEYAPQGSTDHIHTIIRDPTNDYGEKLTQR
jgi:hypothetical protein